MNGRDFLRSARRLAANNDEADWRSAASRAYYAVFHVGRDLLASLRFRTPRADRAHNYLYARLNNSADSSVEAAATLLHELRTKRNVADYDIRGVFTAARAAQSVNDADDAMRILDTLTPIQRTQITDAMKIYEQGIGDVTWQP